MSQSFSLHLVEWAIPKAAATDASDIEEGVNASVLSYAGLRCRSDFVSVREFGCLKSAGAASISNFLR